MSNQDTDDVLEKNVSHLLEGGGDPPRLADLSRAKIRAELIARHAKPAGVKRSPLLAVGFGLAAAAAAAAVITRVAGGGADELAVDAPSGALADGSTWLVEAGAKVSVLGPRHVRVEGAALLDVVPGKGVFVVETAQGRIEVLGTRFFVAAEPAKTTTAVVRGMVKLASDAGEVTLHAGEQGIAEHSRPPTRGPAPRLSHLVSWAAQARRGGDNARSIEPIHHGTLFAKDPGVRSHPPWGDEYPLPMKQLKVDVVVENQVARVALDQTFHNDEDQALEGTYRFAIPPDAALQRLAMYVDGKLMESAVVERMQARRIYEELVYRRVDPALLEWAGTGRLNLRIYPIPARQDKRLMLAYTQSLPKLYEDWTLTVPFPEIDQPVGDLAFDVRVKDCGSCELSSTSHQISSRQDGADAVVTYHKTGERIGDSLVIHVRDPRKQVTVATSVSEGERYFMVRAPSEIHGAARAYRPRTWVILDDVSASRGALERKAQAAMVDAFLRELDEDDRVAVVAFDVAAREILAPTRVLGVDRVAVRAALEREGGVGATDVGVALETAMKQLTGVAPEDAMIVYLGDGVITSGVRKLDALRMQIANKAHFVGVGVGDGPDTQTLEALAGATGGFATTIDLSDDVGWRTFDLVAALHTARVTDVQARFVDATGALVPSTTYLRSPQLADGEEIELVTRLAGAGTPVAVELRGVRDGASDTSAWTQRIALETKAPQTPQTSREFVPRLWAQRHIAARMLAKHEPVTMTLPCSATAAAGRKADHSCPTFAELREERDEAIRKEVIGLGKKYFLLSRHTSLLVLENDAMYAQYGVAKGAGETWAPYAMPATIPVVVAPVVAVPSRVARDAELVRAALPLFYDYGGYDRSFDGDVGGEDSRWNIQQRIGGKGTGMGFGVIATGSPIGGLTTRIQLGLDEGKAGSRPDTGTSQHAIPAATVPVAVLNGQQAANPYAAGPREKAQQDRQDIVSTEELGGARGFGHRGMRGGGGGYFQGFDYKTGGWLGQQPITLVRLGQPRDPSFDDVTAWIPALLRDGFDGWRGELRRIGGDAPHTIDDASRELLTKARAQLPSGVYRWDDFEIAVDSARRIGWRRITDANLHETASFDGATWTRRYAELGLDVTRTVTDDEIALDLAYLPILVGEPAHWARWFDVSARGPRQIALGSKVGNQATTLYVLELDAQYRVIAITDGDGKQLLQITWATGPGGPTSARVLGNAVEVGFTAQAIGDATAWAHQAAPAQPVVVELPTHLVAYAQDQVTAQAVGSVGWRHAQRQLMASYAATQDRSGLAATYLALVSHGGVELGDLTLAASGIATSTIDKDFATALAPFGTAPDRPMVARYLFASRAYGKDNRVATFAHVTEGGLVAQLFTLREASAKLAAGQGKAAVDTLLTLDGRATQLRLIGAAMLQNRYDVKPEDIARAWENAAIGPMKNVARGQAAQAMWNRGLYDAGAERIAQLIADLDLHALPPNIGQASYMFNSSRRGAAGWQIVWAMWRERVLANGDYDHVMALLPAAPQNQGDVQAILARASVLAGDDVDRRVALARIAVTRGQGAWAQTMIEPLLKAHPSHDLYQLAASLALAQNRTLEALALLESAQYVAGNEAVDLATVRGELGQLLAVAQSVAVMEVGTVRESAVNRALAWGAKWRAIDEGNPMIDQQLGELLLATGDTTGAWRQLSTVIERDPMAGRGYTLVAEAFERQGRVADALAYWQQAIVLDQTDPTPRLRKAQALIALGRAAEGDALLGEIANRTWHDTWSSVVWQAKGLLERGKPQR